MNVILNQSKPHKTAVVAHSGGMDSSLCLALAVQEHGAEHVLAFNVEYGQRHHQEVIQAKKICEHFGVDQFTVSIDFLSKLTTNALMDKTLDILHEPGQAPNTLVLGRNGLIARLAAICGDRYGVQQVYLGVIEVDASNSGYRDCSRHYMDLMQEILRIDLGRADFEIKTPVVYMSKAETLELGLKLGILDYLLENTISCYRGIAKAGCQTCPACQLRNEGIKEFLQKHPAFKLPYELN